MIFSQALLNWFDQYGRHDLPWQGQGAYAVWLSEIMLQQTQVTTVIPYFQAFIRSFPTITALADASEDVVLAHWAGLGYYNRARNLHRAAQHIRDQHQGEFPAHFDAVLALPGIGRSTAGAILAQAFNQSHAILDGNVKRVLARYFTVPGWPGQAKVQTSLWQHAEALLPNERFADYTQACMDLGALVCKRQQPLCSQCPVAAQCQAQQQGVTADFPARKPKAVKPVRNTIMLLCRHEQTLLLYKRPTTGIWPGLWSLPEISSLDELPAWLGQQQLTALQQTPLTSFRHTFSHYHLDITPRLIDVKTTGIMDSQQQLWYNVTESTGGAAIATPAPVTTLLDYLRTL